jgi:hypothetical protein
MTSYGMVRRATFGGDHYYNCLVRELDTYNIRWRCQATRPRNYLIPFDILHDTYCNEASF